jgi:hypothetical protein
MRKLKNILLAVLLFSGCEKVNKNLKNQDAMTTHDSLSINKPGNETHNKGATGSISLFDPVTLDTILNFSLNTQVVLKHSDSVYINEYFLDNKVLDSLSRQFDNRHLEALAIEAYLLKTNSEWAKRDSKGLHVKLKNGAWKLLPLDEMADEADNTFEYFFKEFGYYSIRVQWGEGNGYKLVNYTDGTITNISGRPYFSPDGRYIITVNFDIEAGYSENGFQLFRISNKGLQLLGAYHPDTWGPVSVKWLDNSNLILKNVTEEFGDDYAGYLDFYAELKIESSGK